MKNIKLKITNMIVFLIVSTITLPLLSCADAKNPLNSESNFWLSENISSAASGTNESSESYNHNSDSSEGSSYNNFDNSDNSDRASGSDIIGNSGNSQSGNYSSGISKPDSKSNTSSSSESKSSTDSGITPAGAVIKPVTGEFHVSPSGNDNNPGTIEKPFASIQKARNAIREFNRFMDKDIVVYLHKGDYYINNTIEFTETDSGKNGYSIIYKNYDAPGSARLIGGKKVSNWTRHSGDIYKTRVDWEFHTMYENGKRSIKARYPNYQYDSKFPMTRAPYLLAEPITPEVIPYTPLNMSGWKAYGSSHYLTEVPQNAIDGNLNTRWATGELQAGGQWFMLDMLANRKFDTIRLNAKATSNYPGKYSVYVSNDGISWGNPIKSGTGQESAITDISFPSQNSRYLKIEMTEGNNKGGWWTIAEIYLYDTNEQYVVKNVDKSYWDFKYRAGDLDLRGINLQNAQIVHWEGARWDWFMGVKNIESVDVNTRTIKLAEKSRYIYADTENGCRYFIQGALQLLDQPGEFYYNPEEKMLYYMSRDGEIKDQEIIVPTVKQIISLKGTSTNSRAENIKFEGLSFEYTDFTDYYRFGIATYEFFEGTEKAPAEDSNHKYLAYNYQSELRQNRVGMMYLENTRNITVKDCKYENGGFSAIFAQGYNENNIFYGNLIRNMGYSGIYISGPYPGAGNGAKNNTISNCLIHDVGELIGHAAGVYIFNGNNNEVSYSEIYNSPRYAVSFNGIPWVPKNEIYIYNNVFKYLKIHKTNQDSGDTGAIYGFGISHIAPYLTNTIEQVTINSIYNHSSVQDVATNGIFMDNNTYGQTFRNVEITNTARTAYRENASGNHINTNVSWLDNFNKSLMQYNQIGLKSDFKYGTVK